MNIFKALINFIKTLLNQYSNQAYPSTIAYVRTPLSWEKGHPERVEWSNKLIEMLSRDDIFPLFDAAKDIKRLRPDWAKLNKDQKINCLAEFFCQLSIYESSWNQSAVGKGVSPDDDALGLFQIGFRDQEGWGTGTAFTRKQLLTALPNIEVAILIMKTQLKRKSTIVIKKVGGAGADGVFWAPIYEGGKYDSSAKILPAVQNYKLTQVVIEPVKEETNDELALSPWIAKGITMLGWTEFDHDKELAKFCWPATDDCKGLKSVIGSDNAWCSGWVCGCLEAVGVRGSRSGSASSYRDWADACGYIFGAVVSIRHTGGGNHVGFFLWWIDEKKKIAAILSGNSGNAVTIGAYNLSGNAAGCDEVVTSPRWPKGMPKTKGPYQPTGWKVGTSVGSSTR